MCIKLFTKIGWMENEECGVRNAECGVRKIRSVWKIRSMENGVCGVCGNALTLTALLISKHFNAFIQHEKYVEMFYS